MQLRECLPEPMRGAATDAIWSIAVREQRATCDRCIQARGPSAIYKDSLKCCTFFPVLHCFAIGGLIEDTSIWLTRALGQRELISEDGIFLPLGLMPSLEYQKRWRKNQPQSYGNDPSLLCPHFIKASGRCSIWKMRPSPCLSFHCESSFGLKGIEFWAQLEKLVASLEFTLAKQCLFELGFTKNEIALSEAFLPSFAQPNPHALQGAKREEVLRRAWLEFADRPDDFYRSCHAAAARIAPRVLGEMIDHSDGLAMLREQLRGLDLCD